MWMRNAMRCGMRKLNQSMKRAYPGPTDKIRQIPDPWWMAGCNQKYDSSQKSYLAFVWQKPQSSDANGLPRPWVSQYWLQRWQVWQQRPTTWTLGTVRLMNAWDIFQKACFRYAWAKCLPKSIPGNAHLQSLKWGAHHWDSLGWIYLLLMVVTGSCKQLQGKDTRNCQELSKSKAKKDHRFWRFLLKVWSQA